MATPIAAIELGWATLRKDRLDTLIGSSMLPCMQGDLSRCHPSPAADKQALKDNAVERKGRSFEGDIVVLATGDIVPADCRLLEADEIKARPGALDRSASRSGCS